MSGIYIKGMEMPKRCEDCFCYRHNAEYDYAYCNISSVNVRGHGNARLNNCPFIAVPDHHDLIDKNDLKLALMDIKYEDNARKDLAAVFREINLAKPIIPADKEGGE